MLLKRNRGCLKRLDASTRANIPQLSRVIERPRHEDVTRGIEVQRYNFGGVAEQRVHFLICSRIPNFGRVVKRCSRNVCEMRNNEARTISPRVDDASDMHSCVAVSSKSVLDVKTHKSDRFA